MATDWDVVDLPSAKATEINKQRQKTYGDPTPNMEVFAGYLSVLFGHDVSAEEATMVCILLKVMRESQSGYKAEYPDNVDDICGWSNVLFMVKEAHRGSQPPAS